MVTYANADVITSILFWISVRFAESLRYQFTPRVILRRINTENTGGSF